MKSSANPVARVANELTETKSPGDNVTISLDAGLQQTAYEALGDHAGAVIAMDPMTGYILCMVSKPSFDPNTIVDAWDAIVNDPNQNGELLNRCTQGLYAPGSTFKIFMTLAYLREHGDDPSGFQFNCTGAYQDPSDDKYIVHCFDGEVHGQEDLSEAFANSCNAAFSRWEQPSTEQSSESCATVCISMKTCRLRSRRAAAALPWMRRPIHGL